MNTLNATQLSPFALDIKQGLDGEPRHLSSKWFYDDRGSQLFRAIMDSPEYYLTDAELEIFQTCGPALLPFVKDQPFDLIELGAGDGTKTQHLIEYFHDEGVNFAYRPVDISANAIDVLGELVQLRWPALDFQPIEADYFVALDRLGGSTGNRPRLVLFPGANIGNFPPPEAIELLKRIRSFLQPGDLLLTGFDLRKDPAVILAAYNDPAGHTAAFNLNLLTRINRELRADFVISDWKHWETYDPVSGTAKSYLVPTADQTVRIRALKRSYTFRAWQPIHVEVSQKYSLREIEGIADAAGFAFVKHLQDGKGWFVDSLWRV